MGLLFDSKLVDHRKQKNKRPCDCAEAGCETCPLRKKKKVINIHKIEGRKIAVWAEAPGGLEEFKGKELIGKAGQLLWNDAAQAGFSRSDCDLQNVVRCRPTQISEFGNKVNRTPTPEEIWHCSPFNTKALTKMKAKVHLVLGQVAAKTLLGKEFRKDRKIFWSDRLQAKVVCTFHPSYFLRGGIARSRRREFRDALKTVAAEALLNRKGKFAYIESQSYKGVEDYKHFMTLFDVLEKIGKRKRLLFDLEYGRLKGQGEELLFCAGVTWKPGFARVMMFDAPGNPSSYAAILTKEQRREIDRRFKSIMENPRIKKGFHYGVSDCDALRRIKDIKVRGFTWDTHFSEYIAFSNEKKYGLDEIAYQRYPQFAGYKSILDPWKDDKGRIDFSRVPRDILVLYNGADTDLCCRIYRDTRKLARFATVRAYTFASFIVEAMQGRGPTLDTQHAEFVKKILPARVKELENKLKLLAGNPNFNPRAPGQVEKVMYEKLRIPKLKVKKLSYGKIKTIIKEGTALGILDVLGLKYEFPKIMAQFRRADKMEDYLDGYITSALLHDGELRTLWWLAGTIAGRMRSGAGKKGKKDDRGLVNLQNIHGDPLIENLLVSDERWREILKNHDYRELLDLDVFIDADYSQVEVRILAHMANDKRLIRVINSGTNIHAAIAEDVTGRPAAEVKEDRSFYTKFKSTHFALIYGKKPQGILEKVIEDLAAEGIKSDAKLEEIEAIYNGYFKKYRGAAKLIKRLIKDAKEKGYTETIFGFQREVTQHDDERGTRWENQAVNSPIQGSAHMFEVIAMAVMYLKPKKYNRLRRLIMEVHDALYARTKLRYLFEAHKQFIELLEVDVPRYAKKWFGVKLKVSIPAETKAGFRLGTMVEYTGQSIPKFLKQWRAENADVEKKIEKSIAKLRIA